MKARLLVCELDPDQQAAPAHVHDHVGEARLQALQLLDEAACDSWLHVAPSAQVRSSALPATAERPTAIASGLPP